MKSLVPGIFLLIFFGSCAADGDLFQLSESLCAQYASDNDACIELSSLDSAALVEAYLGTWYLQAAQSSPLADEQECLLFEARNSPIKYVIHADGTWRHITSARDTTFLWEARYDGSTWALKSQDADNPLFTAHRMCGNQLVSDLRLLDGGVNVFAQD